jgi:hypothetical protein
VQQGLTSLTKCISLCVAALRGSWHTPPHVHDVHTEHNTQNTRSRVVECKCKIQNLNWKSIAIGRYNSESDKYEIYGSVLPARSKNGRTIVRPCLPELVQLYYLVLVRKSALPQAPSTSHCANQRPTAPQPSSLTSHFSPSLPACHPRTSHQLLSLDPSHIPSVSLSPISQSIISINQSK